MAPQDKRWADLRGGLTGEHQSQDSERGHNLLGRRGGVGNILF